MYLSVKHLHITFAVISICLFCVRYYWALSSSPQLQKTWVKIVPHCIDTGLLTLGVYLMVSLQFWPTEQPWLLTKLLALLAYILLGTYAIKRGKTLQIKRSMGIAAILVYLYMINVAISHNPFIIF
ncbi:MAG: regulator SirB [Alteromonas sp.]|nr:regulator SirB [Alteromonas sp.]